MMWFTDTRRRVGGTGHVPEEDRPGFSGFLRVYNDHTNRTDGQRDSVGKERKGVGGGGSSRKQKKKKLKASALILFGISDRMLYHRLVTQESHAIAVSLLEKGE